MAIYFSRQTGNWSTNTTWLTGLPASTYVTTGSISAIGNAGAAPQSGAFDKFIIRNPHVVTYDTSGIFGDGGNGNTTGTTTSNINTASIILSGGTLRASRTQNTALTAIGLIWVGGDVTSTDKSFLDWGTTNDPVSAVTASISLSSNTGAGIQIRGSTSLTTTLANSACFCGLEKTKNTFLTLSAAANSNIIVVDNALNWKIGDYLVIESDTVTTSRSMSAVTIQSIGGVDNKTITINPSLNFARLSGTRVGNFTSTVSIETVPSSTLTTGIAFNGLRNGIYQLNNISLKDFGSSWRDSGTGNTIPLGAGNPIFYSPQYNLIQPLFRNISYLQTRATTTVLSLIEINGSSMDTLIIDNISFYTSLDGTNTSGFILCRDKSNFIVNNSVCYKSYAAFNSPGGYYASFNNCYLNTDNVCLGRLGLFGGITGKLNKCKVKTNNSIVTIDSFLNLELNSCDITTSPTVGAFSPSTNSFGTYTLKDCTLFAPLSTTFSTANLTLKDADINIFNSNNDGVYRNFNSYHYCESNFLVRKNGITSIAFNPRIANTPFEKKFYIPAKQGVVQKIKGNIRFDSNYGTSNPPIIKFSGAVDDTTFTCPAIANTWHTFEYNLTPNLTTDIEIKITGQSSNTTGTIYLDGMILDPFITDVRWYGFQVDKNAYRTADTSTTLTENQVSSVDITNLDRLYDASNYWTINNPLSTSYLDLYTRNGAVLDFGNRNIVFDNSASTNFTYASASNTITIKTPMLSAGNNFNTLKTTGNITLTNGDISFITINGNVFENIPVSLSSVNINGTLTYNTNSPNPTKISFTNCNVLSATNLGTANVVIKKLNSTITYA